MRPLYSTFFLLIIFLVAGLGSTRELPEDVWKTIMNGEVMPEAIKNLLHQGTQSQSPKKFVKDFDAKPNAIIYHSHVDPHEKISGAEKFVNDFDVKPQVIIYHSHVNPQEKILGDESQFPRKFVKDFDVKPNVIIYHSHAAKEILDREVEKVSGKNGDVEKVLGKKGVTAVKLSP